MRKTLALAVLAAAAATLIPASSASAQCITTPVGGCINPCLTVAGAYRTADNTTGGVLPNIPFACTL